MREYSYNGISYRNEKEHVPVMGDNVDTSHKHVVELKKPESKREHVHDSVYVKF